MKRKDTLRAGEISVLEALWKANKPLSQPEILELIPTEMFSNRASAYNMISGLLKKGLIEVAGVIPTTKNYSRIFTPTITEKEYLFQNLGIYDENFNLDSKATKNFCAALISDDKISDDVLDDIEAMIIGRRKENKKKK